MPKVGFVSLGCPKNLVDSEVMMGILARAGYELTPRAGEADVLVVNTCSFIAPAQQESVQSILEMAEYKKFGKAQKLIVAGCMVERYRNEIREQIPEVDAVIGTGEIEKILSACEGDLKPAEDDAGANGMPDYLYHDLTPRILATPRHTAYIKINEGCDHPCTFCVIPQLRGKFRSRRFESVVREAENLAAAGVREISLIGQDTTFYGEDLGLRNGLPLLLERLAQIEDLHWVRFLYCYPNRVTPQLLETIAAHPRLAKYIDMPLQHASRSVLARMKRGSNGDAFLKMLEKIRKTIPGVSIRTSFIVGFPGETERDFNELCDFVRAAEFDWMGVFAYSDEDKAQSFACDGKVDSKTIARRRRKVLMGIQKKISGRKLRAVIGQRLRVMLEGPSKDTDLIWEARLEGMAPEIDGKVFITEFEGVNDASELPAPGTLATIEVTKAKDYDLIGRVVEFRAGPPRFPIREQPVSDRRIGVTRRMPVRLHHFHAATSPVRIYPRSLRAAVPAKKRTRFPAIAISRYSLNMQWKCPICRKPTDSESSADFPFCSERCRLLDLGNWASEKYIVSEPIMDESESETPQRDQRKSDAPDDPEN